MKYFVYILSFNSINKFHFIQTQNIIERIKRHNSDYEKSTSKGKPWKLAFFTNCNSRTEAMKLERKIKNFKSQKRIKEFIENKIINGRVSPACRQTGFPLNKKRLLYWQSFFYW